MTSKMTCLYFIQRSSIRPLKKSKRYIASLLRTIITFLFCYTLHNSFVCQVSALQYHNESC